MRIVLAAAAIALPTTLFAAGGGDETAPPKPASACKGAQVYDEKTKKWFKSEESEGAQLKRGFAKYVMEEEDEDTQDLMHKLSHFVVDNRKKLLPITTIIIVVVIAILLSILIGRGITRPISNVTKDMGLLAEGDLSITVSAQDYTNEIGDMSKALRHFKNELLRIKELEAAQGPGTKPAEPKSEPSEDSSSEEDNRGNI